MFAQQGNVHEWPHAVAHRFDDLDIFGICSGYVRLLTCHVGAQVVGGLLIARHQRLDSQQGLWIASGRDDLAAVAQCLGRNRLDCA